MRKILIATVIYFFGVACARAEFVSPYVKKDGTFVNGYYRNPKGLGGYSGKIVSVPVSNYGKANYSVDNLNATFYQYYKKAAMLQGDMENVKKLQIISQYEETKILWQTFIDDHSYCHDEACFVRVMQYYSVWPEINKKINNIYEFIASEGNATKKLVDK